MKRILMFALLTAFVSCQNKDVTPELPTSDALYRTWKLTRVLQDGKPTPTDYTQYKFVITFPRDGNLLGNQTPRSAGSCCSPVAFEGTNTAIRFIWVTPASGCAAVYCLRSPFAESMTWQITTLNGTSLVLTGGNTVLEFDAQP